MAVVLWAWESNEQRGIQAIELDEDLALVMARALHSINSASVFSTVRVFKTPMLDELDFLGDA